MKTRLPLALALTALIATVAVTSPADAVTKYSHYVYSIPAPGVAFTLNTNQRSADHKTVLFLTDLAASSHQEPIHDQAYLKNLQSGHVTKVSTGENGAAADVVYSAQFTYDEKSVILNLDGSHFITGQNVPDQNLFVKRLSDGAITPVSTSATGELANQPVEEYATTRSGRYFAFGSSATNLVPGDNNGHYDIFVKDLQTGTVKLASTSSTGVQANDECFDPSITEDGNLVAFACYANNLVPGDTNNREDIFLKNMTTGQLTRISVSPGGKQANGNSDGARISPAGGRVAFNSEATNLVKKHSLGTDMYISTVSTGALKRLSTVDTADISPDWKHVLQLQAYSGVDEVAVERIDGTGLRMLTRNKYGHKANRSALECIWERDSANVDFISTSTNLGHSHTKHKEEFYRAAV